MMSRNEEIKQVTSNIHIDGAKLVCRNFAGKGGDYNDEGDRNFGVLLDDELAEQLAEDGWNVRHFKARPDADDPTYEQPWLKVKVKFGKIPPIAVLINSRGKIKLDEETIEQLDWTNIDHVELIIRPYNYPPRSGRPGGVSAYLKSIYVKVKEDDLDAKYANIPWLDDDLED